MFNKDNIATICLLLVLGMVLFITQLFGQTGGYPLLTNTAQTRPQAIPTSSTIVISQDAYICLADFSADGESLTIKDRQATPITWLSNTLGTTGNVTSWFYSAFSPDNCRWMPNGFTIQAGATGVTGYMVIKCPTRCVLNWGM